MKPYVGLGTDEATWANNHLSFSFWNPNSHLELQEFIYLFFWKPIDNNDHNYNNNNAYGHH